MADRTIQPAYSGIIWAAWVAYIALIAFAVWMVATQIPLSSTNAILELAGAAVFLSLMFCAFPVAISLRYHKLEQERLGAVSGSQAGNEVYDFPPRLISPPLPIRINVQLWGMPIALQKIATAIAIAVAFSTMGIFSGIAYASLYPSYGSAWAIPVLFCSSSLFLVAFVVHQVNDSAFVYIATEEGLSVQKRWTRQFVRWQDVRLFYCWQPQPLSSAELIKPQQFARYEIATQDKHIKLVVMSVHDLDKYGEDPQTYPGRVADLLYTIVFKSGVALRRKNVEQPSR